jgi:type I restriction enzyme R subunit
VALYKSAAALVRAYANIADDMPQAGYTESDITRIKLEIDRTLKLREIIRMASGETIDLKAYEADMRYLIDSYIEAKEPKKISAFDDVGLLEVIVQSGMADAIAGMPNGIKGNKNAVAETIANNVRKKIIKEHLNDPAFYEKMSALLKEILDDLKAKRISYEEFLKNVAEQIIKPVQRGTANDTPQQLDSAGKRALYNNLTLPTESAPATMNEGNPNPRLDRVMTIDWTVKNSRQDNWRGNSAKENLIKEALYRVLDYDETELERIFPIIVAQTEY